MSIDPLNKRRPFRRLWYLSKFAGGPARALIRHLAVKRANRAGLDTGDPITELSRRHDESDEQFRGRVLETLRD